MQIPKLLILVSQYKYVVYPRLLNKEINPSPHDSTN